MNNNEKAEKLLNDYIKRLKWSLSKLPSEDSKEIIQEVQGHLQDRLQESETLEDFEKVFNEFGPPDEYARSFLENYEVSVALASASPWQILIQNFRMIGDSIGRAIPVFGIALLYLLSISIILMGILKPLFPNNIGLWASTNPFHFAFGMNLSQDPANEILGYWIIPISIAFGSGLFIFTSTLSRRSLIAISENQFIKIRRFSIIVLISSVVLTFFLTTSIVVVTEESGVFTLEEGKTKVAILVIKNNGKVVLEEYSSLFGLAVVQEGTLIIEKKATVMGSVVLFADSLELGEKSTIRGNVYLFAGNLTLGKGAVVRKDVVSFAGDIDLGEGAVIRDDAFLFAGSLNLGEGAVVRDGVVSFAGGVNLEEGATVRGDSLLFAGGMGLGQAAVARGQVVSFAGGLDLAEGAVLWDDAILFAGSILLSPQAKIHGDVLVVDGNATLEENSTINGDLSVSPEKDRGKVYQDEGSLVKGGISRPKSIKTAAGWRTLIFLIWHLLKRLLPILVLYFGAKYLIRLRKQRIGKLQKLVQSEA